MNTLNGKGKATRSETKALETKRMTTECPAVRVSARSVPSSTQEQPCAQYGARVPTQTQTQTPS